jgi:nucleoside-diphosphate-sugar epimerase
MRIFITGGTGFIGKSLTKRLLDEQNEVVLLLRNPAKASQYTGRISFVQGDLFSEDALLEGMRDCDLVFHMAAYTKPWSKDPGMAYKTNVEGTVNVLEAAIKRGVKKVILTSTGGTMGFSNEKRSVNEMTNPDPEFHTVYEKTKAEAEKRAIEYSLKGLHVVIVNPTRVFGPGELTESNSVTKIIKLYLRGLWRIIPGNVNTIGNYAYIDDVVEGHLLAAYSGANGERYILGGENLSYKEFFGTIGEVAGKKRGLINLPLPLLKIIIRITSGLTKITRLPPALTQDWLDKYMEDWIMSSKKAESQLGYKITPFRTGVERTIVWLNLRRKK